MAKSLLKTYVFVPGTAGNAKLVVPGKIDLQQLLVITDTTKNTILYNFSDSNFSGTTVTFTRGGTTTDYPNIIANSDGYTTINLVYVNASVAAGFAAADAIQIFYESAVQFVRMHSVGTDSFERTRVANPQSMLDADFEYGLQPTKWQTINMLRGYPSIYEVPGTDITVTAVTTDASSAANNLGASLCTVTCSQTHGYTQGQPITIRGLSNTTLGFARAEGTFIVNKVTSATTFDYYAKAKVGSQSTVASITGTMGTPSGSGPYTTTITSLSSYANLAVGMTIVGTNCGTNSIITAINSGTSITISSTATPTAGAVTFVTSVVTAFSYSGSYTLTANTFSGTVTATSGTITVGMVVSGTGIETGTTVTSVSGTTIGFSQALGTVSGTVVFTGEVVSAAYTQLRKGGFFTGASVGYPQWSVYKDGGASSYATINVAFSTPHGFVPGNTIMSIPTSTGTNHANAVGPFFAESVPSPTELRFTARAYGSIQAGTGVALSSISNTTGTIVMASNQSFTAGQPLVLTGTWSGAGSITGPDGRVYGIGGITDLTTNPLVVYAQAATSTSTGAILTAVPSNAGSALSSPFTAPGATTVSGSVTGITITPQTLGGTNAALYARPDSFYSHRPFDGGVVLGTGGPAHGAHAIRMSKKYIRYQSGKSIMYNTGLLLAPNYDIRSLVGTGTSATTTSLSGVATTANSTTVSFTSATVANGQLISGSNIPTGSYIVSGGGSSVTSVVINIPVPAAIAASGQSATVTPGIQVTTDDIDHSLQAGAQIVISGVTSTGFNGVYTVGAIVDERNFIIPVNTSTSTVNSGTSGTNVLSWTSSVGVPAIGMTVTGSANIPGSTTITAVTGPQSGAGPYTLTLSANLTGAVSNASLSAAATLETTTAVISTPCLVSTLGWVGSTVRAGTFDDQNGQFWQYDGQTVAVGYRTSTLQTAGVVTVSADSNQISQTSAAVPTRFQEQFAEGDRVVIRGMTHVVTSIASNSLMYVTPDYRGSTSQSGIKMVKTKDYLYKQSEWNIDRCDGSNGPFNPSGYQLNVNKMQMVGIGWTWYGAGFIEWMLRGPDGNYIPVHRVKASNVNTEAYMRSGNQPVRYEVLNEGPRTQLGAAGLASGATTMTVKDTSFFPSSGYLWAEGEIIKYTGKTQSVKYDALSDTGTGTFTGLTRADTTFTQFIAGQQRTFIGGQQQGTTAGNTGVILLNQLSTPVISHWGSAFLQDGGFDADRGYIFNYAATNVNVSTKKTTAFAIRLAPSVSNAIIGDLGTRDLLNRAQLLLQGIEITAGGASGTNTAIVIEGVLNPTNFPVSPTNIIWGTLQSSAAGGLPSFTQIARGTDVTFDGANQAVVPVAVSPAAAAAGATSIAATIPAAISVTTINTNGTVVLASNQNFSAAGNQPIALTGTPSAGVIAGYTSGTIYYVKETGSQLTVTLLTTPNGNPITVTTAGPATLTGIGMVLNPPLIGDEVYSSTAGVYFAGNTKIGATTTYGAGANPTTAAITLDRALLGPIPTNSTFTTTTSATGTAGTNIITTAATVTGVPLPGMLITGSANIPNGTTITAVSGTTPNYTITLSQYLTGGISAASLTASSSGVNINISRGTSAAPGETIFSFISSPQNKDSLDLTPLKELVNTPLGGRGTFPNGPDVLMVNVYLTQGIAATTSSLAAANLTANLVLRWGEAQA